MAWKEPALGDLKHRIRIERSTEIDDGAGGFTREWTPVLTTAAQIAPAKGGEEIRAERQIGNQPVEITIPMSRAAKTVAFEDRAVDVRTGRIYPISWADDIAQTGRFVLIIAKAGGLTDG